MSLTSEVKPIVEHYCRQFPSEIKKLIDQVDLINRREGPYNDNVRKLHGELHRMKGSAACFGFPEIAEKFDTVYQLADELLFSATEDDSRLLYRATRELEGLVRLRTFVRPENSDLVKRAIDQKASLIRKAPVEGVEKFYKSLRIVFADDDVAIRMLMQDILSNIGIGKIAIAADGTELLEEADLIKANLIITDWHMEPMDGLEFLRRVRNGTTALSVDTPIIFLSSAGTMQEVRLAISQGVDDFLVKPFSRKSVERAIQRAVMKQKNSQAHPVSAPAQSEMDHVQLDI